jgi:predicted DNA-binding transcriptional regulator AlpA
MTTARKTTRIPKQRSTDRHMTIEDVCADLGIARSTFYDWRAKQKAPPCFKLPNGELRIKREDYDDWLSLLYDRVA